MTLNDKKKLAQLQRRLQSAKQRIAEVQKEEDRLDENREELQVSLKRIGDLSLGKAKRPGRGLKPGPGRSASLDKKYSDLLKKDTKLKTRADSIREVRYALLEKVDAIEEAIKKLRKGTQNPGDRHLSGATKKQQRQYTAIKKSIRRSGKSLKTAKRIAAATVRKRANKTIIKAKRVKIMATNPKKKRPLRPPGVYFQGIEAREIRRLQKELDSTNQEISYYDQSIRRAKPGPNRDQDRLEMIELRDYQVGLQTAIRDLEARRAKAKRNPVALPRLASTIKGQYEPGGLHKLRDDLRTNIQKYAGMIKALAAQIKKSKDPAQVRDLERQIKDLNKIEAAQVEKLDRVLTMIGASKGIKGVYPKGRKNPGVTSKSKSNFRKFHGRPSRKSLTVLAPKGTPKSIAIQGPLKLIKTKKATLNFLKKKNPGTQVMLAEGDGGDLHIVSKGSHLPVSSQHSTDFGEIIQIEYIMPDGKPHLGYNEPTEFYHKFGEETGVRPHLETNERGEYLITGGEYYVTDRGIENPRRRRKRRTSKSRKRK